MFTLRNRCINSCAKIYLAEIKMDTEKLDMMLFLFLKIRKKVVKT